MTLSLASTYVCIVMFWGKKENKNDPPPPRKQKKRHPLPPVYIRIDPFVIHNVLIIFHVYILISFLLQIPGIVIKLELQNDYRDLVCAQFEVSIVEGEKGDVDDLGNFPKATGDDLYENRIHKREDNTMLRFKPHN